MNSIISIASLVRLPRAVWVLAMCLLMNFLVAQCCVAQNQSNEAYGDAQGRFKQSLNGLSVLAELFRKSDAEVTFYRALSDEALDAELLVWAPGRLDAPTPDEKSRLAERLINVSRPKLLFIGRDYDATVAYWEKIIEQLPEKDRPAGEAYRERKVSEWQWLRGTPDRPIANEYFRYQVRDRWEPVTELSGELSRGIDEDKTDLVLTGEVIMYPKYSMRTLLAANGEPFVFVLEENGYSDTLGGEVYIVTNGSLLLNLPLVNHENRKIVQRLINLLDAESVAILGSGESDISSGGNSTPPSPNIWEWMSTPPFNMIIPHVILVGIIFCFCYFPIFGRPRKLPPSNVAEFKKHIEATGSLMASTGDRKFAKDAIDHYHQITGHHQKNS